MKLLKYISTSIALVLMVLSFVSSAQSNILLQDIDIDGNSTVDIDIDLFESNSDFCNSLTAEALNHHTIFAVHGINSQASDIGFFAVPLIANNPTGIEVCRVYAIDMPGRGGSGLPTNILFGELTHINYANIIINSLRELAAQNIRPTAIIAHSNGGLNIQIAQQLLVDQGTSLSEEFGITKITMFASVPSAPSPWPTGQGVADVFEGFEACFTGPGGGIPPGCAPFDFDGDTLDVDWDDFFTVDPSGTIFDCDPTTVPIGGGVPPPPTCENPSERGDRTTVFGISVVDEPLNIVRSIFGAFPQTRPITSPGIFGGEGMATLNVVAFEDDVTIGPSNQLEDLFNHLTGGPNGAFHDVQGDDIDHIYLFTNPQLLLENLALNGICLIALPERNVPTLSEWGYISLSVLVMVAGVYYLKFRRKAHA